jgi:uncharacterized C2H2 Zn-finger protein
MSVNIMKEAPFGESKDVLTTYKPDLLPNVGLEYPLDYQDLLQSNGRAHISRRSSDQSGHDMELKDVCSVETCPRATEPFRDEQDLRRHLTKIHNIRVTNNAKRGKRLLDTPTPAINEIDLKKLLCLVEGCKKGGIPYKNAYSLKRHWRRAHQIYEDDDEDEDEVAVLDVIKDEEMDGVVHVDGFLRPFDYPLKHVEPESRILHPKKLATRTKIVPQGEERTESEELDVEEEEEEEGEE